MRSVHPCSSSQCRHNPQLSALGRSENISPYILLNSSQHLYKTIVQPVAVFGNETWAVAEMDINRLGKEDREILRLVHGPMVEQGMWRIRTEQKLRELYEELNIVADVKK